MGIRRKQSELFQVELEQLIDVNHALDRLAENIAWERFDVLPGSSYRPSHGAPGISARLMAALHYLKDQHDRSDEGVVTSEVSPLLLVPTSTAPIQIKCAKDIVRCPPKMKISVYTFVMVA